jgi:hypothetical protein
MLNRKTASSLFHIARCFEREIAVPRWPSLVGRYLGKDRNIDLKEFKQWLIAKEYSKSYISATMSYANRYSYILINNRIRDLDTLSGHKKGSAIKALILLFKFLGTTTQFKAKLEEYGIKIPRPNSLSSFLRIFNNHNSDILKWYNEARSKLSDNEAFSQSFCCTQV